MFRFSVICTVYNHEDYISECLSSIINQDFKDFELIIVNDGSTDNSLKNINITLNELSGRIGQKNIKVSLINIENSGQSAAFQKAIDIAEGQYIAMIDSDDSWMTDKLRIIDNAIDADEPGMILHPVRLIDSKGIDKGINRPLGAKISRGNIAERVLNSGRVVSPATSGIIIRSDICNSLMPSPLTGFSGALDAYLVVGAALKGEIIALDKALARYRIHEQGQYLIRLSSTEGIRKQVEIQDIIINSLGISEEAYRRNSFYARNILVLNRKINEPYLKSFVNLLIALYRDESFGHFDKVRLMAFWTLYSISPQNVSDKMWSFFIRKQVGI
ncbi:glycosyltransferase [Deinococcus sp. 6GRE01]|uniref:glycosyltransferase n=1 Tax=Deinococcus sp. 6GRE01 TaxID=2745873 RepID=UPI001E629275|nr:glycosyltransferase [Deinococcus sp. 6GRE01]MCD0156957.1 glycosyltransferase [Deinococcus sp. 6GRE01]